MTQFKILAQSYITTQRIKKVVTAASVDAALIMVARETNDAGFYVISITET